MLATVSKVYFAHPTTMYGSEVESRIIARFNAQFPSVAVENPNQAKHQKGYERAAQLTGNGMDYFIQLTNKLDGCFLATFADGTVGAGAAKEVETFLRRGAPVWIYDKKSDGFETIDSIEAFRSAFQIRSVSSTRAQLTVERAKMNSGEPLYDVASWTGCAVAGDTFEMKHTGTSKKRIGLDAKTIQYYRTHAQAQVESWEKFSGGISDYFGEVFSTKAKILDVGMGSGRDLARLAAAGHDVYGVEPVAELRQGALEHHPELRGRIWDSSLPTLEGCDSNAYTGLLCSAVLMHIDPVHYPAAVVNMRRVLQRGGRLLICVPTVREDVTDGRDPRGRSFHTVPADDLTRLLMKAGFCLKESFENGDELRGGVRWWTGSFEAV